MRLRETRKCDIVQTELKDKEGNNPLITTRRDIRKGVLFLKTILKESDDMFCNYDQYKDKEVVKKHEQLLKQLGEKDRVFSLEWNEENITLMECCDYCFGHDLTKEECKELSEVFRELAEELEK